MHIDRAPQQFQLKPQSPRAMAKTTEPQSKKTTEPQPVKTQPLPTKKQSQPMKTQPVKKELMKTAPMKKTRRAQPSPMKGPVSDRAVASYVNRQIWQLRSGNSVTTGR